MARRTGCGQKCRGGVALVPVAVLCAEWQADGELQVQSDLPWWLVCRGDSRIPLCATSYRAAL